MSQNNGDYHTQFGSESLHVPLQYIIFDSHVYPLVQVFFSYLALE